jgi:hypothetical protein
MDEYLISGGSSVEMHLGKDVKTLRSTCRNGDMDRLVNLLKDLVHSVYMAHNGLVVHFLDDEGSDADDELKVVDYLSYDELLKPEWPNHIPTPTNLLHNCSQITQDFTGNRIGRSRTKCLACANRHDVHYQAWLTTVLEEYKE